MKRIKSFVAIFSLMLLLGSCESDLEHVTYHEGDAIPAILEPLEESYQLDVMRAQEIAMTIKWTQPDFGYSASVTNNIEMDLAGGDFTLATTLASLGKSGEFSISHSDLNNAIAKLLAAYSEELVAEAIGFDIRIRSLISSAASPVISDVVSTTITPYDGEREYASIALRGDYNGWDFDNSQRLYSANDDENYAGMIFFDGKAANGWKLCEDASWSSNWGVSGAETAEQKSMTLVSGGDNFTIYSGNSYYFEFNTETLLFSMSKPYESWGVVGSFNDWGGAADVTMTLGNANNQFYLEATMEFSAGDEWKIRADNDWSESYGCSDVTVDDIYTTDYGNFTIPEDGSYTIKWYFNKVDQSIEIIKN
ncbi:MAG: SusE domain-containing protein [Rikenellaceae bacterium]